MNKLLARIIRQFILPRKQPEAGGKQEYSAFEMAKGYWELKVTFYRTIKDIIFIIMGIAAAAFGLESFLLPSNFIDGGATGISLLISETTKLPLYLFLLVVNIPFVLVGYKILGKTFAIKTALAITGLALAVAFVHFKPVTNDRLLVAVFGGFFLGAGIGLSVRGGAVLDGTEVLAIFLSRKLGTKIGDIIILINVVIFSAAAWLCATSTISMPLTIAKCLFQFCFRGLKSGTFCWVSESIPCVFVPL